MKIKYIDGGRAILEHESETYRRFAASDIGPLIWQREIHPGNFLNLFDFAQCQALEAAYLAMNTRIYTRPEARNNRRLLLQHCDAEGFSWVILHAGRGTYEVFREESDLNARVLTIVRATKSTPVNGKLRVGNGDNLVWFI